MKAAKLLLGIATIAASLELTGCIVDGSPYRVYQRPIGDTYYVPAHYSGVRVTPGPVIYSTPGPVIYPGRGPVIYPGRGPVVSPSGGRFQPGPGPVGPFIRGPRVQVEDRASAMVHAQESVTRIHNSHPVVAGPQGGPPDEARARLEQARAEEAANAPELVISPKS